MTPGYEMTLGKRHAIVADDSHTGEGHARLDIG
jgi:hypothetical protein